VTQAVDELERGREAYATRAWMDAYESLSRADAAVPVGAEDLELLATSASIDRDRLRSALQPSGRSISFSTEGGH
jgi:hypothetical protein